MEENKGSWKILLLFLPFIALTILLFVNLLVFFIAFIGLIVIPIVGVLFYMLFIKFKQGIVVDKTFIPEHYEKKETTMFRQGGDATRWRTIYITVPDSYFLTLEGESKGKTRKLLFKVPKGVYEMARVGFREIVTKDFELDLVPIEKKYENWVDEIPQGEDRERELFKEWGISDDETENLIKRGRELDNNKHI